MIYLLQGPEFNREQWLYSIPMLFGAASALRLSSCFHVVTMVFRALVGFAAGAILLFSDHRIVTPNHLSRINRPFFDYNAYVSVDHFLANLADSILNSRGGTKG